MRTLIKDLRNYSIDFAVATTLSTVKPKCSNTTLPGADSP